MHLSESFIRKHGIRLLIVGRPNVGKSTLFNRLCGKKIAIVHDQPGVTRDVREGFGQLGDIPLILMDTAGLEDKASTLLDEKISTQFDQVIHHADVILFVIDGRVGLLPGDYAFADKLRRINKPVVLVANKTEGKSQQQGVIESYRLGLGEPISVSAEHGEGLSFLYDVLKPYYQEPQQQDEEIQEGEGPLQLAIVGRPNVGKSTLINQFLGYERVVTSPLAGTTRDAIAIEWQYEGQPIRLIDTAGVRKRAKVIEELEKLAIQDSLRAIQYAQVVILVIDAERPLDKQDVQLGAKVVEEGRCLIIAINKWDIIPNKQALLKEIKERLEVTFPQIKGVPCIPISAKTGYNNEQLIKSAFEIYKLWNKRVSTGRLNRWLEAAIERHPPPIVSGRRIKIKYITQIKTRPPSFVIFCSKAAELPQAYIRYLTNGLREEFDLMGVPLRMTLKSGYNPYKGE